MLGVIRYIALSLSAVAILMILHNALVRTKPDYAPIVCNSFRID
jgi:hypothetical protein